MSSETQRQLCTGDVISLAVQDASQRKGQSERTATYIHSEGFADQRVGTVEAPEGDAAIRELNFRECLFEVTNQLQYGAQKEQMEHRGKYLSLIYSTISAIKKQQNVLESRFLEHDLKLDKKRAEKFLLQVQVYRKKLVVRLKYAIQMSVEQVRQMR